MSDAIGRKAGTGDVERIGVLLSIAHSQVFVARAPARDAAMPVRKRDQYKGRLACIAWAGKWRLHLRRKESRPGAEGQHRLAIANKAVAVPRRGPA